MPIPSRIAQLEAAVAAATDTPARVTAMNALAYELSRTGQVQRALTLAEAAQDEAQQVADPSLTASCFHTIARCRFYHADYLWALEGLLQAARLYHATGDLASEATALAGVGLCQHRLGAQDEARESLLRALAAAQEQGLSTLETNVHNSLVAVSLAAGRIDDAGHHVAAGGALAGAQGDRNLLTKLLANDALVAQRRGDEAADPAAARHEYEAGLAQVTAALALARSLGNQLDEAHCLGNTGVLLRLLGRNAEAAAALNASLELGRVLQDLTIQVETLLELGRLHAEPDPAAARYCFEEAIRLADELPAKSLLAEACKTYSAQLEGWGEPAAALALYKRYDAAREAELARTRAQAVRAVIMLDYERVTREALALAEDRKLLRTRTHELATASQHDPLTGLLNRRGFDERIVALAATGVNVVDAGPLTFAMIDLDHFKAINDTYSHPVGDAVLRQVAAIIRAHCRTNDLAVRHGGDEFLVVLTAAGADDALAVLRRLKEAVDAARWGDVAPGLRVTLSIGAAVGTPATDIAQLIAAADRALYAAKDAGRNRIVFGEAAGAA